MTEENSTTNLEGNDISIPLPSYTQDQSVTVVDSTQANSPFLQDVVSNTTSNKKNITYPDNLPSDLKVQYENLTPSNRMVAASILRYIDKMGKYISELEGAKQQQQLLYALGILLNAPSDEFRANAAFLFPLINKHLTGVFSEQNINRFYQNVQMSVKDIKAMPFLFILVRSIADPKSRKAVIEQNARQMPKNLELASGERALNEQGRINLSQFLGL